MTQYVHPDLGDDPQFDPFEGPDKALGQKMQEFLLRQYPQYALRIDGEIKGHIIRGMVDHRNKVASVGIPLLMGQINQYVLHIDRLSVHSLFVSDMTTACGELLERYKLPRIKTSLSMDDFSEAVDKAPRIGLDNSKVPA